MNSTWLITSELTNQRVRNVLFTCVVYTNCNHYKHQQIHSSSFFENVGYSEKANTLYIVHKICCSFLHLWITWGEIGGKFKFIIKKIPTSEGCSSVTISASLSSSRCRASSSIPNELTSMKLQKPGHASLGGQDWVHDSKLDSFITSDYWNCFFVARLKNTENKHDRKSDK